MTITEDLAKACRFDADQYWRDLLLATEAADDRLSQRWQTFMDAATLDPDKHAQAKRVARSGRSDPLLDLIRLYCSWEDAQAVYQERERWAEQVYQAIGELDTLCSV